ncbi:inositol-tetrakisphosphate 1-kinase [Absidia repens]|uniref:inositol-1,3,4-trisphosphate 5/6-kinase n=1 Tax=Absidia repens TaxID=90262 RepID=A0A1X2IGR9_9FUNG|nr:inositol-tetrakisphosphate 1-kinase [Absidia repens]
MFDLLRPCAHKKDSLFEIPQYIKLDSAKSISEVTDNLIFPLMCKRRTACSSTESHQMTIIPSPQHLTEKWADQYGDNEPVIIQNFIQHDGVIIKVYVARGQIHVSTRPSFINVTEDTATIEFDSQLLPKQFDDAITSSALDSSRPSLRQFILSSDATNIQAQKEALIDYDRLQQMADTLQGQLGLTFYGFDVLLESVTNNYYVVDINYFPGFKNFPKFQSVFVNILKDALESDPHTKTIG